MIRLETSFDTIMTMIPLTQRQQDVVFIILSNPHVSSSDVFKYLKGTVSLITVKRDIAFLSTTGYISATGKGRSVTYAISPAARLFLPLDAHRYALIEPDRRPASRRFNFDLFPTVPATLFTNAERDALDRATETYRARSHDMSEGLHRKELERFVIELSWKSSKIEGNTYTLLDTERLIRDGAEAPDHSRAEARMILNHKEAFDFVLSHTALFERGIGRAAVEEAHKLLVRGLGVDTGMRNRAVGITGTAYQPLDNAHQIREALEEAYRAVHRATDPYTAALLALAAMSYVQPFEDGNKRTARLVSNAILMARGFAPLSYRSVDEVAYREAMIVFYEIQSINALKHIFMEQYAFATEHYAGIGIP